VSRSSEGRPNFSSRASTFLIQCSNMQDSYVSSLEAIERPLSHSGDAVRDRPERDMDPVRLEPPVDPLCPKTPGHHVGQAGEQGKVMCRKGARRLRGYRGLV